MPLSVMVVVSAGAFAMAGAFAVVMMIMIMVMVVVMVLVVMPGAVLLLGGHLPVEALYPCRLRGHTGEREEVGVDNPPEGTSE